MQEVRRTHCSSFVNLNAVRDLPQFGLFIICMVRDCVVYTEGFITALHAVERTTSLLHIDR
jgi:hypothetical protein